MNNSIENILVNIPRLRDYFSMKGALEVTQDEIFEDINFLSCYTLKNLCCAEDFWNPSCSCYNLGTEKSNKRIKYYITKDDNIRWDRIHGRKRKILKFQIKKAKKKIINYYEAWNKYAGSNDVLYVCARIGGNNWKAQEKEDRDFILKHPGFLEKVDDWGDGIFCIMYFKIEE